MTRREMILSGLLALLLLVAAVPLMTTRQAQTSGTPTVAPATDSQQIVSAQEHLTLALTATEV